MEILWRTPCSGIKEHNSVYKEFLEIVGNGTPTGSAWKETIVVSATMSISMEKLLHQIRLRILSCSKMSENHREPEVPEVSPSGRMSWWFARISLEEFTKLILWEMAPFRMLVLQDQERAVVGLGRSAHSHTDRLMNSQRKDLQRMMTKMLWLCWKRAINWQESVTDGCHDRPGETW